MIDNFPDEISKHKLIYIFYTKSSNKEGYSMTYRENNKIILFGVALDDIGNLNNETWEYLR